MERYRKVEEIGEGSGGRVFKARDRKTDEFVAVKKFKRNFYSREDCFKDREVEALRRLKNHPNIVELKGIVLERNELFIVLEYMEQSLHQKIGEQMSPFREKEIRHILFQVLQGLVHMHKNNYVHRDLKPENLLVTDGVLKIADFGWAREFSSRPPYTVKPGTTWYQAPELLLESPFYTTKVDIWAVGAILGELLTLYPVFSGDSDLQLLYNILGCIGTSETNWAIFPAANNLSLMASVDFLEPMRIFPSKIADIMPNASPLAIDLFRQLCSWDPLKRPTAEQALSHPFFHGACHAQLSRKLNLVPRPLHNPPGFKLFGVCPTQNMDLNLIPDTEEATPNLDLNLTPNSEGAVDNIDLNLSSNSEGAMHDFDLNSSPNSEGAMHDFDLNLSPNSEEAMHNFHLNLNLDPQGPERNCELNLNLEYENDHCSLNLKFGVPLKEEKTFKKPVPWFIFAMT